MDDFPLITKEEYIRFESATDAFEHINRAIIDNAKIPDIIDVINSREYTPAEAINLLTISLLTMMTILASQKIVL